MSNLENRMATAYKTALEASHGSGRVSVHVGPAAWDWMRAICQRASKSSLPPNVPETAWGFPVCLESAWDSDRVVVRIEQEIA